MQVILTIQANYVRLEILLFQYLCSGNTHPWKRDV